MTNKEWLDYLAQNAPDELAAWFDAEHVETANAALDGDTEPENEDSRDKLEAEVRSYFPKREECAETVIGWLDRQRAIDDSICDECSSDYYEMQEEHDQMIDSIAKLMRLKQPYTFDPGEPLENIEIIGRYIDELTAERDNLKANNEQLHTLAGEQAATIDWLTAERDNLKDDLIDERGKLNRKMNALREVTRDYRNERDHYREKFGKCIDYADAIHALMDDEGMA